MSQNTNCLIERLYVKNINRQIELLNFKKHKSSD